MEIDEALLEVGGKRPYHLLLFSLINICIYVPQAANGMFYLFIAWTPGHHCRANNSSAPEVFNTSLSQCFGPLDEHNVTKACENGWVYDSNPDTEQSIVTEWDLVCNNDYLAELGETLSSIAAILGLFFITPLADRFGRKPVFFVCLLGYLVLGSSLAFAPSLTVYYTLRFLLSLCVAYTSIGTVMAMELYSTRHRAFAGVGLEIYWLIAYFYLAMLMYCVRVWRDFVLILVVPWIGFIGLFWLLPESAPWLLSVGRKEEAVKVLKTLARRNRVKWTPPQNAALLGEQDQAEKAEDLPFIKQLILLVKNPVLRKHTFMNCLYWFTNDNVYLGIILTSPSLAGDKYLSFTLGGVVEIPAYLLCFFVVPYSRRIPAVVFHVMAGVSLLVAALVIGQDLGGGHQRTILLVVTLLGKFSITSSFAVMVLYTIELFPTNLRGAGASYGKIFGRVGSLGAPFLAYWLKYNQWLPITVMGCLALVTGLASLVLPETCDKKMPQSLPDVYALYGPTKKKVMPANTQRDNGNLNRKQQNMISNAML